MSSIFPRRIALPAAGEETFFLWGARQTGKSTLLSQVYPDAPRIDLLKNEEYRRYAERPELIREELRNNAPPLVVIDEIQKVPALLDEVHWLHENTTTRFALCGSSARRVRHGQANLLGGRGLSFELHGFSAVELGEEFDLVRALNHGYLPPIYLGNGPQRRLNSYVSGYLKEEIAAEGLVRRLPTFSEFLAMAAISDGEPINYTTIARDTGVSSQAIRGYFEVLVDTLLGRFLPSYRLRPKRRVVAAPKFYFHDVGVVNHLARRGWIEPGSELFGHAFENWVFHELCTYNTYAERFAELFYWRLTTGAEVDFVINHVECAIECKSSRRITSDHLKGLRQLRADHPAVKRLLVVSLEPKDRVTDDGIDVIGWKTFVQRLWGGELF